MGVRYLLDIHILLWWIFDDPKLNTECRDISLREGKTMNEAKTHAEPLDPAFHHAEQALFSF